MVWPSFTTEAAVSSHEVSIPKIYIMYIIPQILTIVAEGVDGVFAGGANGGVDAEEEADCNGGGKGDHENVDVDIWGERRDDGEEEGKSIAESEAANAAEGGKNKAFKEELEKNIAGGGTDGFSNTDFASAFSDGDEHDIHNPDAPDDEGNTGNNGEHTRDKSEEIRGGMGDVVAVCDSEISVAFFGLL